MNAILFIFLAIYVFSIPSLAMETSDHPKQRGTKRVSEEPGAEQQFLELSKQFRKKPTVAEKTVADSSSGNTEVKLRFNPPGLKKNDFLFAANEIVKVYTSVLAGTSDIIRRIPGRSWQINVSIEEKKLALYNQAAIRSCSYSNVVSAIKNYGSHLDEDIATHFLTSDSILNDLDRMRLLTKYNVEFDYVLRLGYSQSEETCRSIEEELKNEGVKITKIIKPANEKSLEIIDHIKENQNKYLFALFTIDDKKIGSHSLIVFGAYEDGVICFDPLHGWLIKVKIDAFLLRANKKLKQDIIWIKKPSTF